MAPLTTKQTQRLTYQILPSYVTLVTILPDRQW